MNDGQLVETRWRHEPWATLLVAASALRAAGSVGLVALAGLAMAVGGGGPEPLGAALGALAMPGALVAALATLVAVRLAIDGRREADKGRPQLLRRLAGVELTLICLGGGTALWFAASWGDLQAVAVAAAATLVVAVIPAGAVLATRRAR